MNKLLPANLEEMPAVVAKADSSPVLVRADSGGLHRCDGNGPLPHTCRRVMEYRWPDGSLPPSHSASLNPRPVNHTRVYWWRVRIWQRKR